MRLRVSVRSPLVTMPPHVRFEVVGAFETLATEAADVRTHSQVGLFDVSVQVSGLAETALTGDTSVQKYTVIWNKDI